MGQYGLMHRPAFVKRLDKSENEGSKQLWKKKSWH